MAETAQIELLPAAQVARETPVQQAASGLCYTAFADIRLPDGELEHIVNAVPRGIANALTHRAYYFVPLTIHQQEEGPLAPAVPDDAHTGGETLIAPAYTNELSDRAICHRNVHFDGADCIFISTRLMQDKFALAFELFINIGHHFVESVGAPREFEELVLRQAESDVRGETSHDSWENRSRAFGETHNEATLSGRAARMGRGFDRVPDRVSDYDSERFPDRNTDRSTDRSLPARPALDEKAKTAYVHAAFADAIAIYLLSLTLDFDYMDLREREYPLLAASALAERLRAIAALFPPNPGYDFQILYRRR
jgi:hypothetical protein